MVVCSLIAGMAILFSSCTDVSEAKSKIELQAQVKTLQAKLKEANRHPLDIATEQVNQAVIYQEYVLRGRGVGLPHGYLVAMTAMNYVNGHVVAPVYGYHNELGTLDVAHARPNDILKYGAGICGSAAWTFAKIVQRFGYQVRSVQFYNGPDNHIANEVFYDGAWHYFDPTWNEVFAPEGVPLSMDEARANGGEGAMFNQTLVWRMTADYVNILPMNFVLDTTTQVVYGAQPF